MEERAPPAAQQTPLRQRAAFGEVINAFAQRFVNRWDWYALQRPDGSYRALHQPLTPAHLWRHLKGQITLGVYALDAQSNARWLCLDADDEPTWQTALAVHERLRRDGVASAIEHSRRGGHLWLFLAEPLAGRTVRAFARALIGAATTPEIFPKQDQLQDGPGSLVRLPLGIHRKDGNRYLFEFRESAAAHAMGAQLALLARAQVVPTAYIATVLADMTTSRPQPRLATSATPAAAAAEHGLVARIKAEFDIYTFVDQFVALTSAGRGHCPFHDDTHMSFSVNRAGGYFHCFAGCGGGDVITFWQRYRGLTQAQAIRELAQRLPGSGTRPDTHAAASNQPSRPVQSPVDGHQHRKVGD